MNQYTLLGVIKDKTKSFWKKPRKEFSILQYLPVDFYLQPRKELSILQYLPVDYYLTEVE